MSELILSELTGDPQVPAAGKRKIYSKNDGIYELNSNNNVVKLANTPTFTNTVHFGLNPTAVTISSTNGNLPLFSSGNVNSNYFSVTGSVNLNTISATGQVAGTWIRLKFDAAITLKSGATIILPKSTDINASIGDIFDFVETTAGGGVGALDATWTCVGSSQHLITATTAIEGIASLATTAEVTAGTVTNKIVAPVDLKTELDKKLNVSFAISDHISDYPVLATDAGTLLTNIGAGGAVTFTLPALSSVVGKIFRFARIADQNVLIAVDAGDTGVPIADSANGGRVENTTATETYANITLMAMSNAGGTTKKWLIIAAHGTWSTV